MADMCKDHFVLWLDFPTHDSQCSRLKESHPRGINVLPDLSPKKGGNLASNAEKAE